MVELVELRAFNPQNERDLYPIYNSIRGARVLEEAWNILSGDLKAIFSNRRVKRRRADHR